MSYQNNDKPAILYQTDEGTYEWSASYNARIRELAHIYGAKWDSTRSVWMFMASMSAKQERDLLRAFRQEFPGHAAVDGRAPMPEPETETHEHRHCSYCGAEELPSTSMYCPMRSEDRPHWFE